MTAKGSTEYGGLTVPRATKAATVVTVQQQEQARRFVASQSSGPVDCARLLEMLGLVPDGMELTVVIP